MSLFNYQESFTSREIEVLSLISNGLSNREISQNLHVSLDTVKWYNKQIFSKLGVSNRVKAVNKAQSLNLFDAEETESGAMSGNGNLPAALSSYVGRQREIGEIIDLLSAKRLITITGPGGAGKTRLSLEVARQLDQDYEDGIWFIELASLGDPLLVIQTIANELDVTESVEIPLKDSLINRLKDKHLLLLLDNLEHLLDAAPLISELLSSLPNLSVLGTSRERMHITGEQEYSIRPLELPNLAKKNTRKQLENTEAVALFIKRAQAVSPGLSLEDNDLEAIGHICTRLDGLPLAIELCAPMVKTFSLKQIVERIEGNLDMIPSGPRDLPKRQQTLHQTIKWGRDLLEENECRLFDRLSIFHGGGTLPAIKAICNEGISGEIGALLSVLVNKNLVQAHEKQDGEIYFTLLETIRQYNLDNLSTSAELESLQKLHAQFFTRLAQKGEPFLSGGDQVKWLKIFESNHDNFRAALKWCNQANGSAEMGLLLTGSLENFWDMRGFFQEGRDHLTAALSRPGAELRTLARAKALHAAAHLGYLQGDYPAVRLLLAESLSIYKELGAIGRLGRANALITLGDTETEVGNYKEAAALMKEGLSIMRELDNKVGIGRALWQLGACEVRPGNFETAAIYFEEALPLLREIGDNRDITIAISGLAEISIRQGDYERALELEDESLALRREVGEPWGIAVSYGNLGWIAKNQGDLENAIQHIQESLKLRIQIGDTGGIAWCLEKLAEIVMISASQTDQAKASIPLQRAAMLLGYAAALREPVCSEIDLVDKPHYDALIVKLNELLGKTFFAEAWEEGQAMSQEEILGLANKLEL